MLGLFLNILKSRSLHNLYQFACHPIKIIFIILELLVHYFICYELHAHMNILINKRIIAMQVNHIMQQYDMIQPYLCSYSVDICTSMVKYMYICSSISIAQWCNSIQHTCHNHHVCWYTLLWAIKLPAFVVVLTLMISICGSNGTWWE